MNVRLISISKPTVTGVETPEQLLAYCARVSSQANQMNHETGAKLLEYLIKNEEWSPLEMVSLTVEIETTRDIGRQILRHRSFSFQEFSQRYAAVDFSKMAPRELRLQDTKNRQNSIEESDKAARAAWLEDQSDVYNLAGQVYESALKRGVAKEVARALLPEGLTGTTMYVAGTLRSWYHYCHLRMKPETQKEHRVIATECWKIVTDNFPTLRDL